MRIIGYLALLLLLWGTGCAETPEGPPKSVDELFSEYFVLPGWPVNRPDDHVLWQAAGAWYRDGAFGGTANALKSLSDSSFARPRDEVAFFQGVAQMLLARDLVAHIQGKTPGEEAVRLFDSLPEDSPYREEGLWLKGLTYLRMGEVAKAREALKAVRGDHRKQARQLQKELRRLPDRIEKQEKEEEPQ